MVLTVRPETERLDGLDEALWTETERFSGLDGSLWTESDPLNGHLIKFCGQKQNVSMD